MLLLKTLPKLPKSPKLLLFPQTYSSTKSPLLNSQLPPKSTRTEADNAAHSQSNSYSVSAHTTNTKAQPAILSESFRTLDSQLVVENFELKTSDLLKLQELHRMSEVSRDRLGQWAVESESGVAGDLSGRDRMKTGRHNKVRKCK